MSSHTLTQKGERKLAVALAAIDAGMAIIALEPRSKRPDTRFSPHGSKSAVHDPKEVRAWLREDPTINLAGVLRGTSLLAIDVDGPEGEAALEQFGLLPKTRETQTRDGRHMFFDHRGKVKGTRIGLATKLDVIVSGYVVLPESTHPEGGRYKTKDFTMPIAELPRAAILAIEAGRKSKTSAAEAGGIPEGRRDNRLTSLAGSFRRQGFGANVIETALSAVNEAHCNPPLPPASVAKIVQSVARYDPADAGLFESMANVKPRDVDFLWDPYLVRGAINLLEGDPNVGKTFLLCEIAAAVSAGRGLPGQKDGRPANVLFLSAEDDPATTLVPRLMRMKADLKRITFSTKFFRLEEEALGWIEKHVEDEGVEVVILDPLLAYMQGGIDMNKANETRPFMARLAELASSKNVTIIALRHLTKGDKEKAIFRGLGSIDITASARSAVLIGEHPEDPALRAMVHIKHNLSERGATQLYELAGGDREKRKLPKVTWRGPCDLTPDDFIRPPAKLGRPNGAITDALDFIERELAGGPVEIKAVLSAGEKRSFSERTIRRAAREMGVQKVKRTWKLAKKSL
jgi:hypothetical protein